MDIRNKTVVVTGAGRGIGRAIALRIAGRGANVALFDLNPGDLEETRALCEAESVQARSYKVNVADEGGVSEAMTRVVADFGRLDGLVNNAGIVRDGLLVKVKDGVAVGRMSMDQWNAVIGVNLTGVFLCAREAAAHMI
jgi:3-oxoacyl-[acyl-carrier protein] reductase